MLSNKTLDEIGIKYGYGKVSKGIDDKKKYNTGGDKTSLVSDYYRDYEEIFKDLRYKKNTILEIGILQGRSLATFVEYFENSIIHGIDINLKPFKEYENELKQMGMRNNYYVVEGNSTDKEVVEKINVNFDIIIDDGDHTSYGQINTFNNFFYSHLNNGGIYIIEDIHDSEVIPFFINKLKTIILWEKDMLKITKKAYKNKKVNSRYGHDTIKYIIKNQPNKDKRYIKRILFLRRRIIIYKQDY